MTSPIVVNLLGEPGVGKSIFCAKIFAFLKLNGVNCEMSREFAKDIIYQDSTHILENQLYVYSNQQFRLKILDGKVDVVVTDAPLITSAIYDAKDNEHFKRMIISEFKKYNNMNFYLQRVEAYETHGRLQDEESAAKIDLEFREMLDAERIDYEIIKSYPENSDVIARKVLNVLNKLLNK